MFRTLFLTGFILLVASVATGEYYQYTDESGNIRFTDDMTQVPESRRDAVEKFESETSDDYQSGASPSYGATDSGMDTADEPDHEQYAAPGGETFEARAEELNKLQSELSKTREALDKERAEIEAQAPGQNAKSNERIAYSMKVDALNSKIEKYEEELKAFEEKVEAFNNRAE